MMLFCEHRHTEGCPLVMYNSVITFTYAQRRRAVCGTGALLRSERCVAQCAAPNEMCG
jgi:hypothetical protein